MPDWRITAGVGVVAVALAAAAVVVATNKDDKSTPQKTAGAAGSSGASTSASPAASPQDVAQSFLAAWAAGDYDKAAALTDDPAKAAAGLKAEMTSLAPQKVTLTLGQQADAPASGSASGPASPTGAANSGTQASGAPTSAAAPNAANAASVASFSFQVADDFGNNLVWQYKSGLNLVAGANGGSPAVHWAYSVIHPSLLSTHLLKAVPPKLSVVDSTNTKIDTTAHPSLLNAVNALQSKLPAGQTPQSLTVEFTDAKTGSQISGSQSFSIGTATSAPVTVKTTLKPAVQNALEAAVKLHPNSAIVAIQPSTGNILGMATNAADNLSMAYKAARAPGSTFKVVTTALALQQGLKPTDKVNCSPTATVEGKSISNDTGLAGGIKDATLKDAFVQSCNTAFVHLAQDNKLGSDYTALSQEAKTYFGMNQKWDLGMGQATYGALSDQQVPAADGLGEFARDAFGQGKLTMSPLTMASVAATVAAHQFHQPILVPGTQTVSATPLPDGVATELKALMQGVTVAPGTAAGVFAGLSGIAAKTGSAETAESDKGGKTDSWMIAFDPNHDIAFGALVLGGGFGRDAAGPEIAAAMKAPGVR